MFTYILRFTIAPGHHEEERFERLLSFCKNAGIDDVMFFVDCEELNQGHVTPERLKVWLAMLGGMKQRLNDAGVSLSLNPWTTILHGDRGRTLASDQHFGTMCDRHGRYATAQACPISTGWRRYIADIYALYATIEPRMIWVEDDFRFHNHPPLEWGGCFCDEHMALFSQMAGKQLTREEFVEGMLKPGEPHPYRRIWLETCRQTSLDNAKLIAEAVHRVSPKTQVGLMTSKPEVQSAEWRDWPGLMRALSGPQAPSMMRPHLPMYREDSPQHYQWEHQAVSQLTRAFTGPETIFYPELDNGPFSPFSVSVAATRLKLYSAALLDSEGITMSLFDMIGTGVMFEKPYEKLLSRCKPLLKSVAELTHKAGTPDALSMLVDSASSTTLHTRTGADIEELYPNLAFFKSQLAGFGIGTAYTEDAAVCGQKVAVCGQQLRNMTPQGIAHLFEHNHVLLDGESAEALIDMGLGSLIGAQSYAWEVFDAGTHTYEEIVSPAITVDGGRGARFTSQAHSGDYLNITYAPDADITELTQAKNPKGQTVGRGQVLIGAKHAVFPYGRGSLATLLHQDPGQRAVSQHIMRAWGVPLVPDAANLVLQAYRTGDAYTAVLLNFSHDAVEDLRLCLPADAMPQGNVTVYDVNSPDGRVLQPACHGDGTMALALTIGPAELAALQWRTARA